VGWSFNAGTVQFQHNGAIAAVHADGNHVAWVCPCGQPILFVYQNRRIGSAQPSPTVCQQCHTAFFLNPQYGFQPEPPAGQPVVPAALMTIV
jgi:hypothetical protein